MRNGWRWMDCRRWLPVLLVVIACCGVACDGEDLKKEEPQMPEIENGNSSENQPGSSSGNTPGNGSENNSDNNSSGDSSGNNSTPSDSIVNSVIDIEKVTKTLCNAKADDNTVATYDYFLSIYGKRTLPGIAESNISSSAAYNSLLSTSASRPVVVCYDLNNIFTDDYSNLAHIVSLHNAGDIVSFAWEWKVPAIETDTPDRYSSAAESGFSILNAVNMSRWEGRFIEEVLDRVAEPLRALQAKGVTVLFAPMLPAQSHWWGEYGAPYFRELWKLVYDRLTVKHGLNNLIWVWSTSTDVPNDELLTWYPGDKYVDIIGVSAGDAPLSAEDFSRIDTAFLGKRMLTCTHAGTTALSFSTTSPWLYSIHQ